MVLPRLLFVIRARGSRTRFDLGLKPVQELCGVGAVHLSVMELEGDGETCPEKPFFIFAPNHKWIIENAAVHPYSTVNAVLSQGRSADDHAVLQIMVFAAFPHLAGKTQVVPVELRQVRRKGHIAGADLPIFVQDDGVDGKLIVANQLIAHRKGIEFLNAAGGLANAPAHQHIEFKALPEAATQQPGPHPGS